MTIKRIMVSNFKSFDEINLDLSNFSVLIGANASGKSNFIQVFRFLRDLADFGLESAILMQSGTEYFRNLNIGSSKNFSIEITCGIHEPYVVAERELEVEGYEATYGFTLKFLGVRRFEVVEEKLLQKCNFYRRPEKGKGRREKLGEGKIVSNRKGTEVKISFRPPKGVKIDQKDILQVYVTRQLITSAKMTPKALFSENPYLFTVGRSLKNNMSNISTYDFDPRLSKKAQAITGKAELQEDGSNIAIVLKNIMRSGNKRRRLFNLLRDTLPFIADLGIKTFVDKSLLFTLRESYSGKRFLPASLLSDGTINVAALTIALYFEEKPLVIIEEPERNVHPYLISKIVNMMQEASKRTQVICTTHNPEIIKHVDLKDILLVSRAKDGFSCISRPVEKEEIKLFLKKEMGIEELYIRNLLEM